MGHVEQSDMFFNNSSELIFAGNCEKLLGPGKLNVGVVKLPFTFELKSNTGQELLETYHGVNVIVNYIIKYFGFQLQKQL